MGRIVKRTLDYLAPKQVRAIKNDGGVVEAVIVCRKPIHAVLQTAVRWIPGVSIDKSTTLYHVYQVLEVRPAPMSTTLVYYRVDKDEVVHVRVQKEREDESGDDALGRAGGVANKAEGIETRRIDLRSSSAGAGPMRRLRGAVAVKKTPYEYIVSGATAAPSIEDFWHYDARDANCQRFTLWCLEGNKITVGDALRSFILQTTGVTDRISNTAQTAMRGITDTARWAQEKIGLAAPLLLEDNDRVMPVRMRNGMVFNVPLL